MVRVRHVRMAVRRCDVLVRATVLRDDSSVWVNLIVVAIGVAVPVIVLDAGERTPSSPMCGAGAATIRV